MHAFEIALCVGVAVPFGMFLVLALFGARIGKPAAGWCAVGAVLVCLGLATYVLTGWWGAADGVRESLSAGAARLLWVSLPVNGADVPVYFGVKLDSLTIAMYFMVTLVSTCIFVFSVGYMAGHSDEVNGQSKYHRFFAYLCLFEFSMLGLLISSSLVFLFVFWELVGLCSYLLIGFYFDKKFASDAAIKAFVANRVGDFGFLIGLMLVVFFLGATDLDQAAANFKDQYLNNTGMFAPGMSISVLGFAISGTAIATLMGIGLFCGAIGKSAQFPLHVWLPDAMAGPTPVSALIHAATMVAAGVYLVARVFRLLTPEAQFVVAVIGCITLTITALIAIVQTDIKKVLAYSTLSQLGYMIFGLGVGAWIAALFHLITHAFFKAMLFLGSGQVIEGCHHVQDMRNMGGLRKKMPVTCWTFFVGVLAISGFGIPAAHIGLGGYFSKDEVLAAAYERTYNWPQAEPEHHEAGESHGGSDGGHGEPAGHGAANEHAALANAGQVQLAASQPVQAGIAAMLGASEGHDAARPAGESHPTEKWRIGHSVPPLPKIMFYLPIIIAYVTPFYMMRCWWMTFMGKPRDEHVYEHAHESKLMYIPLVVLAAGTVFASYFLFRPMIADAGVTVADAPAIVAIDGAGHQENMVGLTHHPEKRDPHKALIGWVGFAWVIGMGLAVAIYYRGLALADKIKRAPVINWIHYCLEQKLFFDHVYNTVFVQGTKKFLAGLSRMFDTYVVDGVPNALGMITVGLARISGRTLDAGGVDGFMDGLATATRETGGAIRQAQTGKIRNYVLFGATGATLVVIAFVLLVLGR